MNSQSRCVLIRKMADTDIRISPLKFEYVLFKTDYTSKIVTGLLKSQKYIFEKGSCCNIIVPSEVDKVSDDEEDETLIDDIITDYFRRNKNCTIDKVYPTRVYRFLKNMISVCDETWGSGFYTFKHKTDFKIKNLGWMKKFEGCVLFKCDNIAECMNHYEVLKSLYYCRLFGISDIKIITTADSHRIALFDVDSESG